MSEFFIVSFFLGTALFLFPVFVTLDAYVNPRENRAWFSLQIFKAIKVFGGYAELEKDGIAVNITKKKAVFLPYSQMGDTRKRFEITQGFQLWKFHQVIETGTVNSPYCVLTASAIQSLSGGIFAYLQTRYPFLSLKNSVLLTEEANVKLTLQTTVVFNNLVLVIAIVKKILEAIINWIKTKRSIRFSKKQPNN